MLYEQDMTVQCHYNGHCIYCDRYLGQSCLASQNVTNFVLVENWQDYKDRNLLSQRGIIYDNAIPTTAVLCSSLRFKFLFYCLIVHKIVVITFLGDSELNLLLV